ncbi:retrovirus-related pol polyprotein from transposon TNT 1-94 [Tanacetum coccineum]|uniref:Retrovirus-related pol polyprotein from transposon TNT 1-94 n=1 Tax=Tanacetum coccineum TaxID=301880 RepID=A0ABQ5HWW1_9ASTR
MSPSSSLPSFYELSLDVQSCKLFCKFLYGLTPFVLSNALNGVGGMLQGMGFSLFLPLTMLCSFSHCKRSRRTDWLRVQQMMKGFDIGIHDKTGDLDKIRVMQTHLIANLQQASTSGNQTDNAPVYDSDGSTKIEQIAQPGMNLGQDRQMQMVGGNGENQFRYSESGYSESTRAEGNDNGNENNRNQVRCYNYRGIGDLDKIEEVNANCILIANLQQASTSGNQTDNAPIYDSDGSAEVHHSKNCYDNDIFDMFTQVEQYTELLEPISEPHQVQQNDSNVISIVSSMEQCGGTVEQNPAIVEETHAYFESLYNNLAIESVYHEKCLTKKINALHLSSAKMITTLKEEIANLNNQLSKEKSTISYLQQEKKKLKSNFKIREDELLDKQIQLENKIKELDNILVKTEADESLAKHKALEYELEHLMRVVFSQDIMSIVQSYSVIDISNLQTELEHTKERVIPKVGETNTLSKPVTSNLAPSTRESKVVKASVSTKPITTSLPHVISQGNVNSNSNENDRVPSASKSSCIENKEVEVEEHHRNLLLSKNKTRMSSKCNSIKLAIRNDKSEVVCSMCYGDLQWGNILIFRVYFVEGLRHNLFSVGNRTTNLYIINLYEMASASPIYLIAHATSTKLWLWHQHLSHINFDIINDLAKNDLNDRKDIRKLGAKGDIGFFIGYSATFCAYRVYNQRTKKTMEMMNVNFDELLDMAFEQRTSQKPTKGELDLLFEAMYNDYIGGQPLVATRTTSTAQAPQVLQTPTASTTTADTTPHRHQQIHLHKLHSFQSLHKMLTSSNQNNNMLSNKMIKLNFKLKLLLIMFQMLCSMEIRL